MEYKYEIEESDFEGVGPIITVKDEEENFLSFRWSDDCICSMVRLQRVATNCKDDPDKLKELFEKMKEQSLSGRYNHRAWSSFTHRRAFMSTQNVGQLREIEVLKILGFEKVAEYYANNGEEPKMLFIRNGVAGDGTGVEDDQRGGEESEYVS